MSLHLLHQSKISRARLGSLVLPHGNTATPFFMPIATQAAVKGLTPADLEKIGAPIVLSNTYHLWLRPGETTIKQAGGLHRFMKWDHPILTDSGGYQVFSLSKIRRLLEKGVEFQSHLDGAKKILTPEKAVQIQQALNSDIIMSLDICSPFPCSRVRAEADLVRTTDWARRGKNQKLKNKKKNLIFGIVQGSVYHDLRRRSAAELIKIDFDGYAIGGLAVGEPTTQMYRILEATVPFLPKNKSRYLMGVGYPEQIVAAVQRGLDMFDCVLPTRNARHGSLFLLKKEAAKKLIPEQNYSLINLRQVRYKSDFEVIDKNCDCPTCQGGFSRSYLRHLLITGEPLFARLATLHNVRFYLRLMENIRQAIKEKRL